MCACYYGYRAAHVLGLRMSTYIINTMMMMMMDEIV